MASEKYSGKDYIVVDHLIHDKTSNGEEIIMLPITRYANVMGSPVVTDNVDNSNHAPFFFYISDEVNIDIETLEEITGVTFPDV